MQQGKLENNANISDRWLLIISNKRKNFIDLNQHKTDINYMQAHIHIHTCMHTHTHVCTFIQTHTRTLTHTHTHKHINTLTSLKIHICMGKNSSKTH